MRQTPPEHPAGFFFDLENASAPKQGAEEGEARQREGEQRKPLAV